jgi:tripartite-type tricarboxylate transporter receptor subunit TctC
LRFFTLKKIKGIAMCIKFILTLFLTSVLGLVNVAQANNFPSKPLRIILPFPPGGAGDITTRILAQNMSKGMGQPVIVENRPGAGAVIGYEAGARATPDGYTMLMVFPSFVINPSIRTGLSYDPIKDFSPVGQVLWLPMGVAVNPTVPVASLPELIALARAKPGEISYGTSGAGTIHHVFGEMLKLATNINTVHIPYQGGVPAVTSTAGGHVAAAITNVTEIAPFAMSGKVRAIVVTSPERVAALPDVPTVREAGYPQLEATNWGGLVVPKGTPPAIIARLNAELVRALNEPEVLEKFKASGMFPSPSTPEQFSKLLVSETSRFAKVVKDAGIKVD